MSLGNAFSVNASAILAQQPSSQLLLDVVVQFVSDSAILFGRNFQYLFLEFATLRNISDDARKKACVIDFANGVFNRNELPSL
ncbi:MAG: hypothetical protein R3C28_26305 [Pirellulaceae bacterium]